MTSMAVVDRAGRTWLKVSWSRAARGVALLAPVAVAVVALLAAAPGRPAWPAVFVVVLALCAGLLPDSSIGLMTIGGYVAWWLYAVPPGAIGWAAVAAIALLGFHAAVALAAAGPGGTTIGLEVGLRLLALLLAVAAVTLAVAAVAVLATDRFTAAAPLVAVTLLAIGLLPAALARR